MYFNRLFPFTEGMSYQRAEAELSATGDFISEVLHVALAAVRLAGSEQR